MDVEVGAGQYEEEMLKFRKTLFSNVNMNIKNAKGLSKERL